jgi:hypothetical protein
MELVRRVDVFDKAPFAPQKARILKAANRTPDLSINSCHLLI